MPIKFEAGKCYSHNKMRDVRIYVKAVIVTANRCAYAKVVWVTWAGRILADDEFNIPDNMEGWYEC